MPKGVARDGLWRGREKLSDWVARESVPVRLCKCGCGERIVIKPSHRCRGIPEYLSGHHARIENKQYRGVDKWVLAEQGKHRCHCGCLGKIRILAVHHAVGIPRYLPNHSPRPSLGHGPAHPRYIQDRSQVRARDGRGFTPWVMKEIRERDAGSCRRCGATEDLECDHIIPVSEGGTADASNGQLLCRKCHRQKTNQEIRRYRHARAQGQEEVAQCP